MFWPGLFSSECVLWIDIERYWYNVPSRVQRSSCFQNICACFFEDNVWFVRCFLNPILCNFSKHSEDATPQALNKTPPKISPGTEKRVGPRLLLIPVHQTSPTLRPLNNVQVPQRQRMILQPLRSPGGVNLFRHPNGQIIQLVPLHQFRAPGTQPSAQPSVQPVMFRNPGKKSVFFLSWVVLPRNTV